MPKQPRLASVLLPLCLMVVLILGISVHQFVNGWLQGMNAYNAGLGKYHNLDQCYR
jgi:hypothetical protein